MNNGFLIPANSKKGTLILNIFRPIDLIIFSIGIATTLIAFTRIDVSSLWVVVLSCVPAAIGGLLIFPVPNYHNVLVVIQNLLSFYNERQTFIWKGWCIYERIANEESKNKK